MIKAISTLIILLIIFFGFFFRSSEDFTLFSPGKATILFSLLLLLFTNINFWKKWQKETVVYIMFILVIFCTALFSFETDIISFYIFELLALIFIYFSGKIASFKNINVLNLILLASIIVGFLGVIDLLQNPVNSFRRLVLSGGYNYSASNFALATTISLHKYLNKQKKRFLILIIILSSLTIAQGSRQAILGLLLVSLILLYKKNKKLMLKLSLISGVIITSAFIYLSQFENITLLQRFSSEHVSSSADSRFVLWYKALIENNTLYSFLFGHPEYNSLIPSEFINNLFNPHNLVFSTYRYHGFFATLLLIIILIQVFFTKKLELIYKLLFFITVWYLAFSGELSRSFHFIFILGFCHDKIYNNIQPFRS